MRCKLEGWFYVDLAAPRVWCIPDTGSRAPSLPLGGTFLHSERFGG